MTHKRIATRAAKMVVLGACVSAALMGCVSKEARNILPFEGIYFKVKVKGPRQDRAHFTAEVRDAAQSEKGARQAVHYEATKYCIAYFGTSTIAWESDPMEGPFDLVDGDWTLRGVCKP